MKQSSLKRIRVGVAVFFFVLTAFVFVDFSEIIPVHWFKGILDIQFIPSLLDFVSNFAITSIGFIIVLILTILFGRIYCSSFCPLGILMDIITRISKRFRKRKIFRFGKAHHFFRYGFLIVTIAFLLFGSMLMINMLDPFSNFGRIMANLIRPMYLFVNNSLASLLESMNIYAMYREEFRIPNMFAILFPLGFLMLLIYFAAFHGRLYCNTVCPVGTLLGLLSHLSVFKIGINRTACTLCGDCSRVCKASCINIKEAKVDMSRCVACYNCLTSCPENGIKYMRPFSSDKKNELAHNDPSRRKSIATLLTLFAATIPLKSITQGQQQKNKAKLSGTIPTNKYYPISPPGSVSIEHFTNFCTACHLCISACPTQVLQPSLSEYGLEGILQPHLDNQHSFCNYDCVVCSEVCPSGAIRSLSIDEKHKTQIGEVQLVLDNCVVTTKYKDCGSCAEHCPTQAVHMIPWEKGLKIPTLNREICIGCGACEYACPTKPFKAIFVDGNPVHLIVKKAKSTEIEQLFNPEEDFPF